MLMNHKRLFDMAWRWFIFVTWLSSTLCLCCSVLLIVLPKYGRLLERTGRKRIILCLLPEWMSQPAKSWREFSFSRCEVQCLQEKSFCWNSTPCLWYSLLRIVDALRDKLRLIVDLAWMFSIIYYFSCNIIWCTLLPSFVYTVHRYNYRFAPEEKKLLCLCGAPTCTRWLN